MLKHIVPTEHTEPVSARIVADRFPPVLENPKAPVTRSALARFTDMVTGKGRTS